MTSEITVKKGNYGFDLNFTIYASDGVTPKVLTDYVITLKVWSKGGTSNLFTGTCSMTGDGTCKYTLANGNTSTVGEFDAELELTKTGIVEDTETFTFQILDTAPA